jgi:predicted aldo/keto reductase-like oxidoreductase
MPAEIRNQRAPMQYRRFGRTELPLSVITLGGMRFDRGWEKPRDELPRETLDNCRDCVARALASGINHIETAMGYMKSEHAYGQVLNRELGVPRDHYYLMTKSAPKTADEARKNVAAQLAALQTDRIDLYAWHGLNDAECLRVACASGGPVEALLELAEQGVIGSVGFSSHAPQPIALAAVETGLFSFVNLHFYYFFQNQRPTLQAAAARDMGVFIISPNDKGGRLYAAPASLRELTAPATPIQWNARYCLSHPEVHTLSFGMTRPAHFDEMLGVLPAALPLSASDARVLEQLDARLALDPHAGLEHAVEALRDERSGINVPEVLRLRRLARCYDLIGYAHYRYNMFGSQGHWYPGVKADAEARARMDRSRWPAGIDLDAILREAHELLSTEAAPETGH